MISLEDGKKAVKLARDVVENHVRKNNIPSVDLKGDFLQKQGVFTTLHTFPDYNLRGCIGIPLPVMPLKDAIIESAKSATADPRFPKLKENEIDKIVIEITILTKPELITVSNSKDYFRNIEIGRDGLIVEQGFYKGLLLPQVPIEQNWGIEEYLSQTCMKAGLLPDAWFDKNTKIYKFTGQIFTEIEPKGKIMEKNLDGSNS